MPPRRSNKPTDGSTQHKKTVTSSKRPRPRKTSPAAPPKQSDQGRGRDGVPRTNRRRLSLTASEKALDDVEPLPDDEGDHMTSVPSSKRPHRRNNSPPAPPKRSNQPLLRFQKTSPKAKSYLQLRL
ncbi:uncharacterized protein MELLADRAFT_104871 [Melampsora larici-populina 98AG31]|uniref:Uncharacterized protein n=1 Tax=Melampsora larici-populina (strain 98AG31 / pathotype 3-4-7) TaxID=747676 RepID=F4RG16_MELLP|nr:uncharacterized protein MELLADRAFT_104871 [Melampsora larici-populina 98AG31]EGG08474.1 hypothetical protein MELLADRAFT_104871 [Melampsora larici-populina 98AG31]